MSNQRVYSAQPLPSATMVVAPGGGGNRNAKNMPVDSEGRDWSHTKCGCLEDCSTCTSTNLVLRGPPVLVCWEEFKGNKLTITSRILGVLATFVPCVVYGQNKHRYQHLHNQGTPHPDHGGCWSGACWGHAITSICG